LSDTAEPAEPLAPSRTAAQRLSGQLLGHVPHGAAIGLRLIDVRKGMALVGSYLCEPYLVGDPETGVISGGVVQRLCFDDGSGFRVDHDVA